MKGGRVSDLTASAECLCSAALTGRFTNSTSPAAPAPQTLLLPPKTRTQLSSSPKAVKMLVLRRNIHLLQSKLHAVLEQSSSGNNREGRDSVPGNHKQGVLSSTSRPGYSRSAWPRCRCSPGCCTLHTQTQGAPHLLQTLPNSAGKCQVTALRRQSCPDVRLRGAEGSPSANRNCNHKKP